MSPLGVASESNAANTFSSSQSVGLKVLPLGCHEMSRLIGWLGGVDLSPLQLTIRT
jgi:hypothetical protein